MNDTVGSLTKEFPLDDVDRTMAIVRGGMRYDEFRRIASHETHRDIPALVSHRFLLVQNGVIVRDRFLSFAAAEGLEAPRIRKIMYLTWALRDYRLRRFILERICSADGTWRPNQVMRKENADFFTEFFRSSTAPKVRSNIEYFLVEAGIFDPATRSVHLELDDGWLPDAIQVAAQHEPNLSRRRAMLSDPIDFLIATRWNGLANATTDQLRGIATSVEIEQDVVTDDEICAVWPPPRNNRRWNRRRPTASSRQTTTAQINLVARERANQAHHNLERLMASAAEQQGLAPQYNEQIDLFFNTETGAVLAEMKSCCETNVHAQVRRGISQLFEYEFLYSNMLRGNVAKVLVLEVRPQQSQAWILNYVEHLGIVLVWKNETENRLETTMIIPQALNGIVTRCE